VAYLTTHSELKGLFCKNGRVIVGDCRCTERDVNIR